MSELAAVISAIAAALATIFAWLNAKYTTEESKRNRQSFEFSWQPLIEITFDIASTLDGKPQDVYERFILPVTRRDKRVANLPSEAQKVVHEFEHWREQFRSDLEYQDEIPHPNAHYLLIKIRNLQKNPVGDAFNIKAIIEFEYAPTEVGIERALGKEYEPKTIKVPFTISRIGASQAVYGWLAHIQDVPNLIVRLYTLECEGWGKAVVRRSIAGWIEVNESSHVGQSALSLKESDVHGFEKAVEIYSSCLFEIKDG